MDSKDLIEVQNEAIKDATAHIQAEKKLIRRLKIETCILTGVCIMLLAALGAVLHAIYIV